LIIIIIDNYYKFKMDTKLLIDGINSLIYEISEKIDLSGQNIAHSSDYHSFEESYKNEFIDNLSKGKYTIEEILQISKLLLSLINLEYIRK
jgi:ASC-1-like (ASCH) protein